MRPVLLAVAAVALVTLAPQAGAQTGASDLKGFTSPSKNIGCLVDSTGARCDIRSRDWSPPKKPSSCELDYGQGLTISKNGSRGRFVCAGDTAMGGGSVLRYGNRIKRGSLTCTSRESGITCSNKRGHGFTISKQRYKRF